MSDRELAPVTLEIVSIDEVKDLTVLGKVEERDGASIISRADAVLDLASDVLGAAESSRLFKVEVPDGYSLKDLVPSGKDNEALRALVRDPKGRLNGAVSLKANGMNPAQLANIGLAAAAMVVGQAYMTEISDSLDRIDEKLDLVISMMLSDKKAIVKNAYDVARRYANDGFDFSRKNPMELQAQRNEIESSYNKVGEVIDWLAQQLQDVEGRAIIAKAKEKDLASLIDELHTYESLFDPCIRALSTLAMTRMLYDGKTDDLSARKEQGYIADKSLEFLRARRSLAGVLEIKIGALKGAPVALPRGSRKNLVKRLVSQTPRAAAKTQLLASKVRMQADLRDAYARTKHNAEDCQHGIQRIADTARASRTVLTDGTSCWLIGDPAQASEIG